MAFKFVKLNLGRRLT